MRIFKIRHPLISVSILVLFISSCIRDDLDKLQAGSWNPEFAIPLVDTRIGVDRLLNKFEGDGFLTTDAENVVVVVYKGTLFEIRADELFDLNDFSIDLAALQNSGIVDFPSPQYLLQTVDLEQGTLKIHIEEDTQEDVRVTLNMPKSIKNGLPFKESFTVKYSGGTGSIFDTIFDIRDYRSDLTGNGNENNKLQINYEANKVSNNDSVLIDIFQITFQDLSFSFIDGYLGNLNIATGKDSIVLDVFKNFKSGRIILEDPKFNIDIENSFGFPLHMSFGNFEGSGNGKNSQLDGDIVNNGINVGASDSDGSSKNTKETIDNSNSNISQFLEITPDALKFDFNLEANADNDTTVYNFVSNTSSLVGKIDLNIPLKGSLDSVIIEDIFTLEKQDLENLERATFKLVTDNSFPVGLYVQIYFLDQDEIILDSLIETNSAIFREAITNAEGFSISTVREESFFTIGEARFASIREYAIKLKIRVMLLSDEADKKTIKITNENYFDLKLGVRASFNFSNK